MLRNRLALVGFLTGGVLWGVSGATSQQIFEQVEPSVVFIGNDEGFASGVIVSSDGKILTNYHVILTALPLTVKAKVMTGGNWTEMSFNDVSLIGVHREYDLALLQIKNSHYQLKPLTMSRNAKKKSGAGCYVIGNPSSGNEALRNTITAGLISSAEREIEGLSYIQISAAINPGNSGGALVDEDGRLIGIAAFKPVDTEGIGFAIPVQDFKASVFVSPKERTIDKERALESERKGSELYNRAARVSDLKYHRLLLALAGYYYRMSLMAMPASSSPYHNMGLIYRGLGDDKLAKAYFMKAYEMAPDNSNTLHILGMAYFEEGKKEEALKLWMKGSFSQVGNAVAPCAYNAGVNCMDNKDYAGAAYLSTLSLVAEPDYSAEQLRSLQKDSFAEVSEQVRQLLASKKSVGEFSLAELQKLKGVESLAKVGEEKTRVAQQAQNVASQAAFEKRRAELAKRPDAMTDAWVQKKVPKVVIDAVPAFGGMTVALAFKDLGKIGIMDLLDGSINKYLTPGGPEFLMAAGGSRLVVFLKGMGVVETYDLNTMEKVGEKKLAGPIAITAMVMGLNNPNTVFISYGEKTDALSARLQALLDPLTGRVTPLKSSENGGAMDRPGRFWHTSYRDQVCFVTDANLNHLTCWCLGQSPSGFEYASLDLQKATFVNQYQHVTFGALTLSDDGTYLFTEHGHIYKDGIEMKHIEGVGLYPVLGGNFMMELKEEKQVTLRALPSLADVMKIDLPPEYKPASRPVGLLRSDKRLIASALAQRLVAIDAEQAAVYIHPLKVGVSSAGTANSLFTRPGALWTYDLQLAAGEHASIADAPKGMALVDGVLRWQVAEGTEKKVYEILVNVKDAKGSEDFRVVKLLVQ